MPDVTKTEDVIRLEERTRGLERSDRRHYLFELVLLLAFVGLCLLIVNGCEINTPTPVKEDTGGDGKERKKEWLYTAQEEIDSVRFEVGEDAKSVLLYVGDAEPRQIVEGESFGVYKLMRKFSAEFAEEQIQIYSSPLQSEEKTLVGTFNYE